MSTQTISTAPSRRGLKQRNSIIPGLALSLGLSSTYLGVLVLLPLALLALVALKIPPAEIWRTLTDARTLAAYKASIIPAFIASMINFVFGSVVAWVLVRKRFPGRQLIDALIDLPFAMPTAVVGIALVTLYGPGTLFGSYLTRFGLDTSTGYLGITLAMIFVSLPFVIRTVQPVLEDLDPSVEQAAASLGASPASILWRVFLPQLLPAMITGFILSFAKSIGEFGAVIFLAGNIPGLTEVAPLLIMVRLEEFAYPQAAVVAIGLLLLSFALLLVVNTLQARLAERISQ
jgi:sulfate transport system permease protein